MATKTLEARFEHLSVNDENDSLPAVKALGKPKVRTARMVPRSTVTDLAIQGLAFNSSLNHRSGKWPSATFHIDPKQPLEDCPPEYQ